MEFSIKKESSFWGAFLLLYLIIELFVLFYLFKNFYISLGIFIFQISYISLFISLWIFLKKGFKDKKLLFLTVIVFLLSFSLIFLILIGFKNDTKILKKHEEMK